MRGETVGPEGRRRLAAVLFGTLAALLLLAARVGYIQLWRGPELAKQAQEIRTHDLPVAPKRGEIVDAHGNPLAVDVTAQTVVANPAEIRDPAGEARKLAPVLGMPEAVVRQLLSTRTEYQYVKRKVDEKTAQAVRDLRLPGIYLTQESQRFYPDGTLAANVLGFTGIDDQGLDGVEAVYNKELQGKPGAIQLQFDARSQPLPQAGARYKPPVDGLTLELTIDRTIQTIVEQEIERVFQRFHPLGAWALVMDPNDGAILAMAQRPTFDPNHWQALSNDELQKLSRDLLIDNTYPPGSVFKPVTAAIAIQNGKVTPETPFYDPGSVRILGQTISNWNGAGRGATNFGEGFQDSANVVFAKTGLMIGKSIFYQYLQKFGFTAPTGVDLPGEALSILPPESRASDLDLALMSFGQTLTVTPIAMARAIAAIANGGHLVTPHVAKALLSPSGRVVKSFDWKPSRQVISAGTAATVRSLMERVVQAGTGVEAQIPGYRIGGKTGTSQKVVGGRVVPGKNIASFIGLVPVDRPRLLIYVMVDEPQGVPYGGQVAAPVFHDIAVQVLNYLQIPPDASGQNGSAPGGAEQETVVPNLVNLDRKTAEGIAQEGGVNVRFLGSGPLVLRQLPAKGAVVVRGSTVYAYTDPAPGSPGAAGKVTVPDLQGRLLSDAADLLASVGLRMEAQGDGVVTGQTPAAGSLVDPGSLVKLRLTQPPEEGPTGPP
ncbi:MAG: penicillin-binding transpeptidase domain-containing protein [Bacillota bacterium]|nr:penicillin-binding transpeptidase domain-containing protein [Bacillota bacterium]